MCPHRARGVIAVAATSVTGQKASYSNYGQTIALSAPGGDGGSRATLIVALSNTGKTVADADTTSYVAGTSFSAPIVAGVASLVLAVAPQITAAQMRSLLIDNAKPFPAGSRARPRSAVRALSMRRPPCCAAAALAGPLAAVDSVDAVEFYNASLDHYFMTPLANEIARSGWRPDRGLGTNGLLVQGLSATGRRNQPRLPVPDPARAWRFAFLFGGRRRSAQKY